MKRLGLFSFAIVLLVGVSALPRLSAQTSLAFADTHDYFDFKKKKKKKKKKEESASTYSFKEHIWFGGGLDLGYSGGNGESVFGIGVSPMAGYKIFDKLSAGPRVSAFFASYKIAGYKAFNLFDLEVSAFLRFRAFKGLFLQGEVGTVSDQYVGYGNQGDLEKFTQNRLAKYLGVGYNFSNGEGGVGTEISVMYDFYLAEDINSIETPLKYRFAFTYNF